MNYAAAVNGEPSNSHPTTATAHVGRRQFVQPGQRGLRFHAVALLGRGAAPGRNAAVQRRWTLVSAPAFPRPTPLIQRRPPLPASRRASRRLGSGPSLVRPKERFSAAVPLAPPLRRPPAWLTLSANHRHTPDSRPPPLLFARSPATAPCPAEAPCDSGKIAARTAAPSSSSSAATASTEQFWRAFG